ncbi:helix-turn-helix transcriptional regulator [Nocardia colli]|uniref:Helix-turn-helix transcriptional regulator n=1 Tax=Nocardia colli TaxID=2545717 RepID=A0A5N0E7H6_9NOCA|nr:helix-turn-helix domain-containing protein [Nocardia colli]KAA8884114.1 helix-turn-helix transcriptional regulator [Nocardia colli]
MPSATEVPDTRLPEPDRADLRLDHVLAALSDPLRLTMIQKLLTESPDTDRSCGWFDIDRPKSTLTHHFRVLREAGVTRQQRYGLERRSKVRIDDLEARFPGLLDLVRAWKPGH